MADEKITQLPTVTNAAVGAISIFPIVDSTDVVTKSIALNELDLRWIAEPAVAGTTGEVLTNQGLSPPVWAPAASTAPNIQVLTSGSGTYTTPVGALYLEVEMVGGGGGGASGGTAGGNGSDGTDSIFGASLLQALGGKGALSAGSGLIFGGAGGSASLGTGPVGIAIAGGGGSAGIFATGPNGVYAGSGGVSAFGGAGGALVSGGGGGATFHSASPGSGSGGSGGSGVSGSDYGGSGGGAAGYVKAYIFTPSVNYPYTVGALGAGGTAGALGPGGDGGSGTIIIKAYF